MMQPINPPLQSPSPVGDPETKSTELYFIWKLLEQGKWQPFGWLSRLGFEF